MPKKSLAPLPPDFILSPAELAQRIPFTVKALERRRARGLGPRWIRMGARKIGYLWADVLDFVKNGSGK